MLPRVFASSQVVASFIASQIASLEYRAAIVSIDTGTDLEHRVLGRHLGRASR